MLLIGDSGTGKTGALASLVKAGYELVILDFDNGLDILVSLLEKEPNAKELLARVSYSTCTDKMKSVSGLMVPEGVPKAFSKAMNLLSNWKTEDEDLGPLSTWGSNRILVVDSLTFLSKAAFRWVEGINFSNDGRAIYGEAQKRVEGCLGMLYSDAVKCHVIVTSHISYIDADNNITKGYPSSIGRALSPQIPRYFNTMLQVKVRGAGATAKRVILTVPDGLIDTKAPVAPGTLPAELSLSSGLADFFKLLKGDLKAQAQGA